VAEIPPRATFVSRLRLFPAFVSLRAAFMVDSSCTSGAETVALHRAKNCVVHGLAGNREDLEQARAFVQSKALYGPVSNDLCSDRRSIASATPPTQNLPRECRIIRSAMMQLQFKCRTASLAIPIRREPSNQRVQGACNQG